MKGKDMIKLIKERDLEDMNLEFVISEVNERGIHVKTFGIDKLCDIGYSENAVSFDGDEK
ncbi:hypothetical protein [Clostridium rectalis]|uniref:hypothetical protein n=1 Tax=Clostridium rectalis TaxID=2040295 RepID=UPI000F634654|nr:hypothetical protein [Clostridium rectalis]